MTNSVFKVVAIGPESTGKSTLCKQLGLHFNANVVEEYARAFLNKNGTNYTYNNLLTIAQGQVAAEEKAHLNLKTNLLIADTDMYVMKVWCEYVFGKCHYFILNNLAANNANLYLLMHPNIPWVKDNLREYPNEKIRWELFYYYKDIVVNSGINFIEINSTNYHERFLTAKTAIVNLITPNTKR